MFLSCSGLLAKTFATLQPQEPIETISIEIITGDKPLKGSM